MGLHAIPAGAVCSVRAVNLNQLRIEESEGLFWVGADRLWLSGCRDSLTGNVYVRLGVNPITGDSAGQAYLALKSSAASLVLSICETSLEFSALVHKI